ncbi:MAG: PAS domain S-box protein [Deltaproteobacteria bacterium]|nr:PAS domain S-box protein [Deltaproteobacteria bacterium]
MDDFARVAKQLATVADPVHLLEGLFAFAPVGFQIYDASGHSVVVNKAFRELFGSEPPPDYNILADDLAEKQGLTAEIKRAFAGETVHLPAFWYDPRDLRSVTVTEGRRVAIEMTLLPLRDASGAVSHVASCFKDVTPQHVLAEVVDKLRLRDEELSATLRSIGDGVIATDATGQVVRMNTVAEQLTGWRADEARGRALAEVFHIVSEDTRAVIDSPVTTVLAEGAVVGLANHTVLIARDGRERAIADSGAPIRDRAGRTLGVVLVFRDVSAERRAELEQQRLEAAARHSEARYRIQFEHAPEAIVTFDLAAGKLVEANPAAARLLGWSVEELLERSVADISPARQPDGRDSALAARAWIDQALAGGRPVFEWTHQGADGEAIACEVRLVQLPGAPGQLLCRGTMLDIRERKRLAELSLRSLELEQQNLRIREANRLKSEFLANMSHELRTPLNAIIGFAELMVDGRVALDSPQHDEFLGDILASGRHLLQLINDVLDLAKVEAGKLELHPEPVDLERLIHEVRSILRSTAASRQLAVAVEVEVAADLGPVTLDPARCKQVLYNYLSNALKFSAEGGRITVRARALDADWFRLEVEDTGVGISEGDLPRLFHEFQQLDSGAGKRHQGTGLGLALTRRLAEVQGGAVGVSSVLGRGSVFHAVLPRNAGPGRAPRRPPSPVVGPAGARRVLVVEDDAAEQRVLVEALAAAGYSVDTVTTGAAALARCQTQDYDAITLDLLLPDMNGLDLLAALRSGGRNSGAAVVVVTVVAEAGAMAGFSVHDVLHKPLEPALLLASLRRAGVAPGAWGGVLVVDDDASALRLMEAALKHLGYATVCRGDGESGISAAEALAPAAIVLDLMMPGLDGFGFLQRLRARPRLSRTPVIVWTQKDVTRDEAQRLLRSAHAILRKHDGAAALLAELAPLLPARPPAPLPGPGEG